MSCTVCAFACFDASRLSLPRHACATATTGDLEECEQNGYQDSSTDYCGVDHVTRIAIDLTIALACIYFAATYFLLIRKLRSYRQQNYTHVQVGIVYNTLQVAQPLLAAHFVPVRGLVPAHTDRAC